MIIDYLKEFDRNKLSESKIIYSKFSILHWCILVPLVLACSAAFLYPFFQSIGRCWSIVSFGVSLFLFSLIVLIGKRIVLSVLKKTYKEIFPNEPLNLKKYDYKTIQFIQYKLLNKELDTNANQIEHSDLKFIIDLLKSEASPKIYNYITIAIVLTLIGALLGAYFGTVFNQAKSLDEINKVMSMFFWLTISVSLTVFLVEYYILKDFVFNQSKSQRLITALEHYYLKRYN